MARILGVLGTKICYSIVKNMDTNGPLEFRTVLYSNYDEKLGNHERKTLVLVSFCSKPQYQVYFSLPHAENS